VTIRVVDPTNGNAPYDIKANPGPFQGDGAASLAVDIAWSTRPDFTNTGSGSATATTGSPAQPFRIDFKATAVPDPAFPGGFRATATRAIPADATGSGSALIEGRPTVDVDGNGTRERIPVASAGKAFAITDAAPVAYREIVDIAKCNDCHEQLQLHGGNRNGDPQGCLVCHNAQMQQKNVALHTPELLKQHALSVYQQVSVLKLMPMNNATQITDAERDLVRRWWEAGAPVN
jgi:OmcA/MtrC family decaheme c-type cytochrome